MRHIFVFLLICLTVSSCSTTDNHINASPTRPNLLLILTDDQSWAHTGIEGYPLVKTPNFDSIARQGIYFKNGYVSAPTCTASRSAILSGQDFWRTGTGAVLMGYYPQSLISYQEILNQHGYEVGYTGKGWGPGSQHGRSTLIGKNFNQIVVQNPPDGISPTDYSKNFNAFLDKLETGKPFSFWIGIQEPHRRATKYSKDGYAENDGSYFSTKEQQRWLPKFLPNTDFVRKDFQGYLQQIEHMDGELGRILEVLKNHGHMNDTMIVFASDNGMGYPGGKSNNSLYGVRVPFAVQWDGHIKNPGVNDNYLVSAIDIAPTFLNAAGIDIPESMTGVSFLPLLQGKRFKSPRDGYVVTGFERHAPNARPNLQGYPSRAVITKNYMYIHNFIPDLWPLGDPPAYGDVQAYFLWKEVSNQKEIARKKNWLLGKRPKEMLFSIEDTFQENNLIGTPEGLQKHANIVGRHRKKLNEYLIKTQDPILEDPNHFQSMPVTIFKKN